MASSTTRCCPYTPYSARLGGDPIPSADLPHLFHTLFARKKQSLSNKATLSKVYYEHELKSGRELAHTLLLNLFDRDLNPSSTDHLPPALPQKDAVELAGTVLRYRIYMFLKLQA